MAALSDVKVGKSHPANPVAWVEERLRQFHAAVFDDDVRSAHFSSLHSNSVKKQRAFDRTVQFWTRSAHIYATYKATQVRVCFVRDEAERGRIWEEQHERAADRLHALCCDLKGFFLKSAQLVAKPDLAPAAWVRRLVGLCDQAPQTPFSEVRAVLETELGLPLEDVFEWFDVVPLGSASVAQVHKARVAGVARPVAVKVQHPGAHELMMTDIRNQKMFARILQRTDLKFDLVSVMEELEEQVEYEFDFVREAAAMDRIGRALDAANPRRSPVVVPRPCAGLVTGRVLVMDFVEGTPIMRLPDELARRGINPHGRMAKMAKRSILSDLSSAYGQMILRDGFFQADPHPGNIVIGERGRVGLLDYGQTKELGEGLKLGLARLVIGLANGNARDIAVTFRELGIDVTGARRGPEDIKTLAQLMFDSKLPDGWEMACPFGENSLLKFMSVNSFPKELFFVMRTAQLLRGLCVGMETPFSSAQQWKPLAEAALAAAGKQPSGASSNVKETNPPRKLFWKQRRRLRRQRVSHAAC